MNDSTNTRGLRLALAAYIVVFAAKLAAYFVSGVVALLAESLHTLTDIFISAFLLVAAAYSRKQADETHMFGYGRAQNVAALVAATLFISFTSFELYRESIPRLFGGETPEYQNVPWAAAVLVGSMLVAAWPLTSLFKEKNGGAAAKAQLMELVNDEVGLIAALLGTLGIIWGFPIADPLAAIVVATLIAFNALALFRENASFLLGKSPGAAYLSEIERRARTVPGVLAVRDLRAEYVGPDIVHAGMRIAVRAGLPVEEATRIAAEVHRAVHHGQHSGYCFVEIEAYAAMAGR